MVNSKKKISKQSIAIIVLSLLLVLSMLFALTGAWFTDKLDNNSATKDFGIIDIEWNADDKYAIAVATRAEGNDTNLDTLMPGDTLNITGTVDNKGNAAYVRVELTVTFDENVDFTGAELGEGWSLDDTDSFVLHYVSDVTAVAAEGTHVIAEDVVIPEATPNEAALTTCTVDAVVAAVQQANVAIDDAAALLDDAVAQTKAAA